LLANLANFKGYEREICLKDFDGNEIKLELSDTPKNSANEFYARSKKLRAKALGVEIEKRNLSECYKEMTNVTKTYVRIVFL